jgi:hypothetical protein
LGDLDHQHGEHATVIGWIDPETRHMQMRLQKDGARALQY